jgi:hypothetical protein
MNVPIFLREQRLPCLKLAHSDSVGAFTIIAFGIGSPALLYQEDFLGGVLCRPRVALRLTENDARATQTLQPLDNERDVSARMQ